MMPTLDLLTMGRSSIDLYSDDSGAPFPLITHFAAYVGGSPLNVCVGARRLGLDAGLLTAVGADPVGDFILHFLDNERIDTTIIPRKPGRRTSAVLLGIEPPDRFPLVYYRENCADLALTIDDVIAAPVDDCAIFEFTGTNLSGEPSRSATLFAAERARASGARVVLDIDFRPDQWADVRAFGTAIRSCLPLVDIVIGTEDEVNAAVLSSADQLRVTASAVSDAHVGGDTAEAIGSLMGRGWADALILKTGARGSRVYLRDGTVIAVPGYPVEVVNILGAGDAFGAGFLYGVARGWDWYRAARLGNACGAIVVMAHGCANFMPTLPAVEEFVATRGGW
ncbi:MAG: 5-dehydro-2-deoxygluconokinase [Chloroflexota bacterium]|nr:5-dehydro-2-deoxygluconokinase [Chloroflexota bacterium]